MDVAGHVSTPLEMTLSRKLTQIALDIKVCVVTVGEFHSEADEKQ